MHCPCGTNNNYDSCCGKYIDKGVKAPTAEILMRSRYSAFVVENIDYLLETHDPRTRDELDINETKTWSKRADWQGLTVLEITDGDKNDTDGKVEFIASYNLDGEEEHHHERAEFFKKGNVWFYKDGHVVGVDTFVREEEKLGRNDPCKCGSGKKYKKCCMLN
ncbi:MAG: YchJ family protein [Bdellovibrionales bacterium]